MTTNDVAQLLFAARERIDFYWSFYVVIVTAVIGWLVSFKRPLPVPLKALVSLAYLLASATNLFAIASSYELAEALRIDLLGMTDISSLPDTRQLLEHFSYLSHRDAAIWVHLAMGVPILLAIWFSHLSQAQPTPVQGPDPQPK